jgi:hypothetical protein
MSAGEALHFTLGHLLLPSDRAIGLRDATDDLVSHVKKRFQYVGRERGCTEEHDPDFRDVRNDGDMHCFIRGLTR